MTSHVDAGEFRLCKHIHIDMISSFFLTVVHLHVRSQQRGRLLDDR